VKFDDAKPGTIDQIKPGDQLRARGNRNPDGSEVTAEEIVSGTFRNIAGTVISVDSSKNTVSISDLLTKKPVVVQVTADSQMRKLPAFVAMRIAMRLKGVNPEAIAGGVPGGGSALPNAAGSAAPGSGSSGSRAAMQVAPDKAEVEISSKCWDTCRTSNLRICKRVTQSFWWPRKEVRPLRPAQLHC